VWIRADPSTFLSTPKVGKFHRQVASSRSVYFICGLKDREEHDLIVVSKQLTRCANVNESDTFD
jgi:hypothetical protein